MQEEDYDYTEGASAVDIQHAISESQSVRRFRRDSQVGRPYDAFDGLDDQENAGAVFDGPGNAAVPSSVSRMSHREMSRERSQRMRRMSSDYSAHGGYSRHRRQSEDMLRPELESRQNTQDSFNFDDVVASSEEGEENGDAELEAGLVRRGRGQRRSISPEVVRSSLFESFTHMFGGKPSGQAEPGSSRRRPSLSLRSTASSRRSRKSRRSSRASSVGTDNARTSGDEDDDERWGYSSGEEDSDSSSDELLGRGHGEVDLGHASDVDYGSLPPSPSGSLPNMAG